MEKYFHFDRNKTLQDLECKEWGEPDFNSHLVTTCHKLRKKPIGIFTVEDLRIMIGQSISLEFLIPLALETLEDNILSEGDFFCGDLLESVLKIRKSFWESNPIYKNHLENILEENIRCLEGKLGSFRKIFI